MRANLLQMSDRFLKIFFIYYLLASVALAQEVISQDVYPFQDPLQAQEFWKTVANLRCVVCQNQSLAESQAPLAKDLRARVYEMMLAGKSASEVMVFLSERYGDFIQYQPPLQPNTYLLWGGPGLFLILGLYGVWWKVSKQRMR